MPRVRVSTTVDEELLAQARAAAGDSTDATLLDAALRAFLARHRRAEIDAAYDVYDAHPLSEPDDWGDLESFHDAAASS